MYFPFQRNNNTLHWSSTIDAIGFVEGGRFPSQQADSPTLVFNFTLFSLPLAKSQVKWP